MPTEAFSKLLDRDISKASAREIIDVASPLLQEIVNYSTWVFQRCRTSSKGAIDEDLPVLMIYLHMIEMTDGVEVLMSQSCCMATIPLVRSLFEALLSINYIFENEKDYQRRSYSWLVDYIHQKLLACETLDPSTSRGKEFQDAISVDEHLQRFAPTLTKQTDVQKTITNFQSWLKKPYLQEAETEYQRLREERKRRPPWYQLFGGPPNLRELSKRLGLVVYYDFLYPAWSSIVHGTDMLHLPHLLPEYSDKDPTSHPIRNPKGMERLAAYTATFILRATRLMLKKFRPGEEDSYAEWYKSEVRERHRKLLAYAQQSLKSLPT